MFSGSVPFSKFAAPVFGGAVPRFGRGGPGFGGGGVGAGRGRGVGEGRAVGLGEPLEGGEPEMGDQGLNHGGRGGRGGRRGAGRGGGEDRGWEMDGESGVNRSSRCRIPGLSVIDPLFSVLDRPSRLGVRAGLDVSIFPRPLRRVTASPLHPPSILRPPSALGVLRALGGSSSPRPLHRVTASPLHASRHSRSRFLTRARVGFNVGAGVGFLTIHAPGTRGRKGATL